MSTRTRLAVIFCATLPFSVNLALAQTMGEYGGVTAHAAAGAAGSGSAMRPPEVHINPVASSGSSKTYEVSGSVREDDSVAGAKEKDDAPAKGDDWERDTNQ